MTAKKITERKRLQGTADGLPPEIVAWFSRENPDPDCWHSLVWPFRPLLPGWWEVWKQAHPDAVPREGYEWLNDPHAPEQPRPEVVAEARAQLRRARLK